MNIFTFIKQYADEIGGNFTDYDHTKAIVVVPLNGGRFQTVLAVTEMSKTSGKSRAIFTSKVGDFSTTVDARELLEQNANFDYSKFILVDGQLKVEASCLTDSATEEEVKQMVQEVAQLADQYEMKLTGKDIH